MFDVEEGDEGFRRTEVVSTISSTDNTGFSTSRSSQNFNTTTLAVSAPIVQSGQIIIRSTIIPTMSQWGLLIFGLLVLNLGIISMLKKKQYEITS